MENQILETHLTFDNNVLLAVAVLWGKDGDTRATISTVKSSAGYHSLKDYHIPTLTLFNDVAAFGRYLTNKEKKRYFPNQKLVS
jgi:hypothetical protein